MTGKKPILAMEGNHFESCGSYICVLVHRRSTEKVAEYADHKQKREIVLH